MFHVKRCHALGCQVFVDVHDPRGWAGASPNSNANLLPLTLYTCADRAGLSLPWSILANAPIFVCGVAATEQKYHSPTMWNEALAAPTAVIADVGAQAK